MAGVELATAYVSLVVDTKQIPKDVDQAFGAAEKSAGRAGKSMGSTLSSTFGKAVKVAGAVGIGVSLGSAVTQGFTNAVNQGTATKTLEGLYGDAGAARDMLDDLRKVASKSPIDYTTYQKAAESLAYTGVKGDKAVGILKNVGLAITSVGGSSENMNRANDALAKMVNAGKVGLGALQQLSGTGVPIISGLAKHFGVSMDEINSMASKGSIGLDDVLDVMQNATGDTFQDMLAGGEAASQSFGNQWKIAKDNVISAVGQGISPMLESIAPKLQGIGNAVAAGVGQIPAVFSTIGNIGSSAFSALGPALSSVGDSLRSLWETAQTLIDPLKSVAVAMAPFAKAAIAVAIGAVVGAFKALSVVVKPLAAVLRGIGDFAKNHTTTFRVLAGIVLGAVGAWKAYKLAVAATKAVQLGMTAASYGAAGATYAVGGATRVYNALMKKQAIQTAIVTGAQKARAAATFVMAGAQRALNLAMRMNPIGIIITALVALGAGLVLLYQKSETFRNIVQGAWEGIKTVVMAVWNGFLKPIFDAIGIAIGWVIEHWRLFALAFAVVLGPIGIVTAAFFLFRDQFMAVVNAIGAAFMWVWNTLLMPVFNGIKAGFQAVGTVFQWVWNNVISPAWNALGAGISFVWNAIILPVWNALKATLTSVGTAFQWVWNSIIKPAWDALGAGISWVWNNVIKVAWAALKWELQAVGNFFQWIWNNVIKPAWDALGTGIRWVIDNVIKPAWNGMKTALQSVSDFFGDVVEGIKTVWDKLKGYLATPINFLIGVVWNKGILAAWNKVAEFLPGLSPAAPLQQLSDGQQFAHGGAVFGPGTERSDSIPARLSNNEHVWDAGDVKRAGGQRSVYAMRALLERGIPFTWDTVTGLAAMPMASIHSMENAPPGTDIIGGLNPATIPGFKDGGAPTEPAWKAQLENGHRAAKMRNGNPYTWGFEDCSGYMSMIADAIINGGDGVRRWATSSFPGGQPFVPGLGEGFSVGVHDDPGGPGGGHTAGTLTGVGPYATVNVESGGSHGDVAYGGPAAGADSPQWNGVSPGQFHLAIGADGAFESAGPGGVDKGGFLVKKIHEIIEKLIGPIKDGIGSAIGTAPPAWLDIPPKFLDLATHGVTDFMVEKIGSLGDLLGSVYNKAKDVVGDVLHAVTFGLFDNGGWLQPGMNLIANKTGQPEPVLNPEQWRLMEGLLGSMTGGKPLDMEQLADVSATLQKSVGDAMESAGKSWMDDAFSAVGMSGGFSRWTKVGDEYQKAMEDRRKMDDDKRKKEEDASKPTEEQVAQNPVVELGPSGTTPSTYQEPVYGDPNAKVGTAEVKLDPMPDIGGGVAGSSDVKAAVQKAFDPYGWSGGAQWSAADWIIGKESTWNPTARNPSSGAFGLFQFLGSTKDQYLPDENPDPFIQGKAGARYIQDRYGSPTAAKAFWENNGWYDQGGWLQPGISLVENRTGKPEPVFNQKQWATLEANVKGGDGSWKPGVQIEQHVTVSDDRSQIRKLQELNNRTLMQYGGTTV